MADLVFYLLAGVALAGGIALVFAKNPVASLLFMVATLGSIAGIFVLLEAHFLAAIQVLVYAGAIMVLFLFVIMLLNLGHDYEPDVASWFWVLVSGAATGGIAWVLVTRFLGAEAGSLLTGEPAAAELAAQLDERGAVGAIAHPLFTDYVVAFEVTGILLLVAVVGAIALAKRRV